MFIYHSKSTPSYKLYYHLVIVSKFREEVFNAQNQSRVIAIIKAKCKENGYFIRTIAVQSDHIHLLLSLKPTHNIPTVVKDIKGYSAYAFNKIFEQKLTWQRGYSINTVSEENLPIIQKYIENQQQL